jgi:hypothetical protein
MAEDLIDTTHTVNAGIARRHSSASVVPLRESWFSQHMVSTVLIIVVFFSSFHFESRLARSSFGNDDQKDPSMGYRSNEKLTDWCIDALSTGLRETSS